jgi:uncharacterized membrane protein YhaH (DUF805 family)
MTFNQAVAGCWSKYATFEGRASRAEYWWWMLFGLLVEMVIAVASAFAGYSKHEMHTFRDLARLILTLPSIAVSVRRLHDINRSGWYLLMPVLVGTSVLLVSALVMLVDAKLGEGVFVLAAIAASGGYLVLFVWQCTKGDDGLNRYGDSPYATA